MSHKQLPPEFYALMEDLQAVDFAIVELNLYLDTHPCDADAIYQYNCLAKERKKLKYQIEQIYGPLTHFGHSYSGYPWGWSESPWPWQI